MKYADSFELDLDALDPAGDGLGTHEAIRVHVPGGFPGERVGVRVTHVARQQPRAHAELRTIVTPHPGRRSSPCVHHDPFGARPSGKRRPPPCTGCPLLSLALADQRQLKRDLLASEHGLHVDQLIAGPDEYGYRESSKRVVSGQARALVLGSYVRGSHVVAAMHACQVDHPQIALAAEELRRVADSLAIEPHDEASNTGDLRYVWFKTNGTDVLLTLVTTHEDSRAARELPERLRRPLGIAWSVQPGRGNSLRGRPATILRGSPELALTLADLPLTVGPLGFLQPNPPVAALAYADLVRAPDGEPLTGPLAFDLYAGAGVTTHLLRSHFTEVQPCEAYPESAAALGVAPESAEQFLRRHAEPPALIVANPPREGLGPQVCAELLRLAAPRLHIMSCGPAGLARDLAALAPRYRLLRLRAYDTLPHTPHIELVAWLTRRDLS